MIDPKILKENIQSCKDNLAKRGYSLDDKKFLLPNSFELSD